MNRFELETGCRSFRGMASDEKRTYLPDRMARRYERWDAPYGVVDPLHRKRYFGCGSAADHGWALLVWQNPYMRQIVKERIARSREAGPLPLP